MDLKLIFGIFSILYGLTKVVFGISILVVPQHILKHIPVLNLFIPEQEDSTMAGRLYEYTFILFGIFTILNGMAVLSLLPLAMSKLFESKYTEYTVFIVLGSVLTVFYSLVLFTNLSINKSVAGDKHYKIFGLGSGIAFLCMPLLWELIAFALPQFSKLPMEQKSMWIIALSIFIVLVGDVLLQIKKRNDIDASDVVPEFAVQNATRLYNSV